MPDESLKTYQEVMNYLKSKKKRKIHLLFGNGFSMGYDPQIFSYNALSEFVKKCKDSTILKLFRIVGSTNFELIMRSLDLFVKFGLHLFFELEDLFKMCVFFKGKMQIYLYPLSAFVGIDRMNLRIAIIKMSQYIQYFQLHFFGKRFICQFIQR